MQENSTQGDITKEVAKKTKKPVSARRKSVKKAAPKKSKSVEAKRGRGRKIRNYPLVSFQESFEFAKAIYDFGSGEKVRRLTLFDKLMKSPESSLSRALIINTNKYGLTRGAVSSDYIELSTEGLNVNSDNLGDYEKHSLKLNLAIGNIEVFNFIYNKYKGLKLPSHIAIADIIRDEFKDVLSEDINEVIDLFIVNAKYLNLLKVISGAERLVTFEHCLDDFKKSNSLNLATHITIVDDHNINVSEKIDSKLLDNVCFYVTPIGEENSIERKHSDLFLGSIIEPALDLLNIKVVRADKIGQPGTITKQIIEYLSKAKLVIADLSFNNPNVFYELAIRHAFRLPTVQIIRKGDRIPFDVSNSRTIVIDTTDIYSLVPKIETYRSELTTQVRQALNDPDAVDNPLTLVYPNIKLKI